MIKWELKYYDDLSQTLLYKILKIRQEVFIIEQNCNYLDADNIDQHSHHLIGLIDDEIIAYMRIVKPSYVSKELSFGRILVKKEYRGEGIGRQLMKKAIDIFGAQHNAIVMSAQLYLVGFYQDFDFVVYGEQYLEDNIPHIKMIRNG